MRVQQFGGMEPRTPAQLLRPGQAQLAVNVDVTNGTLRPFRAPAPAGKVVDLLGQPYEGTPRAFMNVGGVFVGLEEDLFWCEDPRRTDGEGSTLFVQGGKLYRTSKSAVLAGREPVQLGIAPPEKAPAPSLRPGQGCFSEWDLAGCQETAPKACDDQSPPEARAYRMTYVTACGEESAPSVPSEILDVANGDGVSLVDTNTPPANAVTKRYYRSAVTTKGETMWLLVAELGVGELIFHDAVCPGDLGGALVTDDHYPPKDCLQGVTVTNNLQTVVWTDSSFWVSEVRLPHAYKPATRTQLPHSIRFMRGHVAAVEGDQLYNMMAGTDGYPFLIDTAGVAPRVHQINKWLPAATTYGHTDHMGVVFYTAKEGIVAIDRATAKVFTDFAMTDRDWALYGPYDVRLSGVGNHLFAWVKQPGARSLAFTTGMLSQDRPMAMVEVAANVTMGVSNVEAGMHVLVGNTVYLWGASGDDMSYEWISRVELSAGRWHPTTIKVEGDFPRGGRAMQEARVELEEWRRHHCALCPSQFFEEHPKYKHFQPSLMNINNAVTITVYCDGDPIYTRPVSTSRPVRLPRVRRGLGWHVRITGTVAVDEVHFQSSINDLTREGGHA